MFKEQNVSLKSNKAVKEEANTTKKVDNKRKGDNSKATVNAAKKEEDQYFYSIEGETRAEKRYFLAVTKLAQSISDYDGIKNSVIEDILDELDSKPLSITKKYIEKGTSVDNEKILIPKGKDIFLAIVQKGDYQY